MAVSPCSCFTAYFQRITFLKITHLAGLVNGRAKKILAAGGEISLY
jgi:hypothetical protein